MPPVPPYEPLDFLVVRAPLLPVEACPAIPRPPDDPCRAAARQGQGGAVLPPLPRLALAVASPHLVAALDRALPGSRAARRADGTLLRYLIRMSSRPTPFGLFAGVALARWGDQTDLALADEPPRTRTRPDMAWLMRLVLAAEARPAVRRQLRMVANPAAALHGGRVWLAERAPTGGEAPEPAVSLRATGAVRCALAAARQPVAWTELAAALLASTPGATPGRVERLLTDLWAQTVLLTDLRPPLTTADPAGWVAARLAAVPAAEDLAAGLAALRAAAAAVDALPPARAGPAWARLPGDGDGHGPPVQVDMAHRLRGDRVARMVAAEAARAAELLLRLSPAPDGPAHLAAYRRAFLARYGPDREVPLLELLDLRRGLGPLEAPAAHPGGHAAPAAARRAQALVDLACAALRDGRDAVELDAATVARLEFAPPAPERLPRSLDLFVSVAAASPAALDAGDFQVVVGAGPGAVGAGRSLGRFADLLPGAAEALARAAGTERARWPLELPAELVWQPRRLRSGNVAVRPAVHAWEIPVGVSPGVEPSRAIPLGELTVAVRDGRLSVRWPARGADLAVTAGHLLNHWQAPAACRFLAEVGRDGRCQLHGFDWGLAERFPFLPRVQAGRVVLRPARWRVDPAELPAADAAGFAAAAARWRAAWRVPRLVQLGAGDNRLLLDLEDARQVEELRRELRRARPGHPVVLLEALPGPGHAWLPGPGGRYAVELAVPLVRRAPRPPGPGPGGPARDAAGATSVPGGVTPGHAAPGGPGDAADRLRPPGSEWLFVKLYCAPEDEEALLAGPVRALAEGAVRAGLAEGWFFVRYADPARHVRLRLRGDPARLAAELLPGVCAWAAGLVEDGACSRFCIDCYEREVDRYGGPAATALAERLFAADSRLVAELLAAGPFGEPGRAGPHRLDRVALAVLTVDDLLDGLRLDPAARLDLYRGWVAARHESGPAWRRRKAELRPLLADPARLAERAGGAALLEHLAARRAATRRVAGGLEALAARGELATPVATLARSYAHMHCNRLLGLGASAERAVLGLALRARESLDRAPVPR